MGRRYYRFCRVPSALLYMFFGCVLTFVLLVIVDLSTNWEDDETDDDEDSTRIPVERLPQDAVLFVPELIEHMDWKDHEIVLHYECGDGAVGYYLIFPQVRHHKSKLYSVDSSWTNVHLARTSFPDSDIRYADGSLVKNPNRFPFKSLLFDKIFAIFVFHLTRDMEGLVVNLRDQLRPGGQLAFTMLSDHNVMLKMKHVMNRFAKWRKYATMPEGKTKDDFEKQTRSIFENNGFKIKYWKVQEVDAGGHDTSDPPIDHEYIAAVVERRKK